MFNLSAAMNLVAPNTSQVNAAIGGIQNNLNSGSRAARNFADSLALRSINYSGYIAVSGAVIKFTESVAKATRDSIRLEVEVAKLAQTFNITANQAGKNASVIRKISTAYGLSAPKIAETVRVLGQAGFAMEDALEAADNLAKTTLLASFDDLTDTTDGLVAITKQFTTTAGQSHKVLSLLNKVSKQYAVESSDLVEAVRKAGGVFSTTGGSLEELVTLITAVRDTTRESASEIGTGFRTIFSKLQRPKTIDYFRELGIELTDLKGNFIGNFEAIKRIQDGLAKSGIKPGSIKFAGVVEELGGLRQSSRAIPLLTQRIKVQEIYNETMSATKEFDADVAKGQETLANKLAVTQQNFSKLVGDILDTRSFKALSDGVLLAANSVLKLVDSMRELVPLIGAVGAFGVGRSLVNTIATRAIRRKRGGFVPGVGSGDIVPALLEPGEFVVNKMSAQAFGYENLKDVNRYATGGRVAKNKISEGRYFGPKVKDEIDMHRIIDGVARDLGAFGDFIQSKTDVRAYSSPTNELGYFYKRLEGTLGEIGANIGKARESTVLHEFGHSSDKGLNVLARKQGLASHTGQYSSNVPGSFQNILTGLAAPSVEKTVRQSVKGKGLSKDKVDEHVGYRLFPEEIFADMFAQSSPAIRKIITSTVNAEKGFAKLAEYTKSFPKTPLFEGLEKTIAKAQAQIAKSGVQSLAYQASPASRASYDKRRSALKGGIKELPHTPRPTYPNVSPELITLGFPAGETLRDPIQPTRPKSKSYNVANRNFVQKSNAYANSLVQDSVRRNYVFGSGTVIDPLSSVGNVGQPASRRFRGDNSLSGIILRSKVRKAENSAIERKGRYLDRVPNADNYNIPIAGGSQSALKDFSRNLERKSKGNIVPSFYRIQRYAAEEASQAAPISQPVSTTKLLPYYPPATAQTSQAAPTTRSSSNEAMNYFAKTSGVSQSSTSSVPFSTWPNRQNIGSWATSPAAMNHFANNTAGLPVTSPVANIRQVNAGLGWQNTANLNTGTGGLGYPGSMQQASARTNSSGEKLGGEFGTLIAATATMARQFLDTDSAVQAVVDKLLGFVAAIGVTQATLALFGLQLKQETLTGLFKNLIPAGAAGSIGKVGATLAPAVKELGILAAGAAAAGLSVYALSSLVDAGLGYEKKKQKAIEQGSVAEAKRYAAQEVAAGDISNFSTGLAAALAVIPVVGPIIGGFTGAILKTASTLPILGDGIQAAALAVRDFAASIGLAESTDLIQSRAGAQAAESNFRLQKSKNSGSTDFLNKKFSDKKINAGGVFESSEFKALSGSLSQLNTENNNLIKAANTQSTANSQTSDPVGRARIIGSWFGLSESVEDANNRLAEEIDATREITKNNASNLYKDFEPAFKGLINQFVNNENVLDPTFIGFMKGLDDSQRQLITLSGNTQLLKYELESAAATVAQEKYEREKNLRIFNTEASVINKRIDREIKLAASIGEIVEISNRLSTSFSTLQKNADLTASASFTSFDTSQLNLSNVTDKKSFNGILGSLSGFDPQVAEVKRAEQISGLIKGDLGRAGLSGAISQDEANKQLSKESLSDTDAEDIIRGQVKNLDSQLSKLNIDKDVKDKIIDEISDKIKNQAGKISLDEVQKVLSDNLIDPAQATADKLVDVYEKQVEAVGKFGDALRTIGDSQKAVFSKRLEASSGLIEFANKLREIQTGKPTTAATLQQQSVIRQSQILGQDRNMAGNTAAISSEIMALQNEIAASNERLQGDPNGQMNEIAQREQNIQRMERLNMALDEQISAFDTLKNTLLEVASSEKEKAKQIKDELFSRTELTRAEQITKVRGESLADAFISGDSRFDPRQLTTLMTKNIANPEVAESIQKQQNIIKAEIDKVASQEGPNQQAAKDLKSKIDEFELQSKTFDKKYLGIPGLNTRQRKLANLAKENAAREEARQNRIFENKAVAEEKNLEKKNPEEFARRKRIDEEARDSKFAIRNNQTRRGAVAEQQVAFVQTEQTQAIQAQAAILQNNADILRQSFAPFVESVQQLINMPKQIDVQVNDMAVNVNLNGLEVFNSISSEVEKMILRGIVDNISTYDNNNRAGNPPLQGIGNKRIGKKL